MKPNTNNTIAVFPIQRAVLALLFTFATLGGLLTLTYQTGSQVEHLHSHEIPLLELLATRVRLNEQARDKVSLAVGNPSRRSQSVEAYQDLLDTMSSVENELNKYLLESIDHEAKISTVPTRAAINRVEQSILLTLTTDPKLAHDKWVSEEYKSLLADFDEKTQASIESLAVNRDAINARNFKFRTGAVAFAIGAIALNLLAWLQIFRSYQINLRKTEEFKTKLEEEQARGVMNSKLASLGEMAGGIAHEINNPLAIIIGTAQIVGVKIAKNKPADEIKPHLDKIIETGERISKIIRGLRSFARNGDQDPFEPAKLIDVFDEGLSLITDKARSKNVTLKIPSEMPFILNCRKVQVTQVVVNLVNNAIDAVTDLEDKWVDVHVSEDAGWISIKVTDSGNGIPQHIQEKIFQPFFTTKGPNVGTGLGLSISIGIVKSHHGSLSIDNSSKNTCFVLKLPVDPNKFAEVEAPKAA